MDAKAWEKVDELIDKNQTKTIKDLFAEDQDRAKKFSLEAAGWFLDYSKNRVDQATMKALLKLAENGDYVNCEDPDGEWCGEAKVKDAVSCACMNKQEEMDKAKAETARNASRRKYAFEPDFTGAKEEGGLAGLYASMVND